MKVVPLIVFANFFLGIYTNLSVWYKLIDKTKVGAYISIVGALVTLALNYLLIPLKGPFGSYYGSAIATIAAYGSMMIISYLNCIYSSVPNGQEFLKFYFRTMYNSVQKRFTDIGIQISTNFSPYICPRKYYCLS